MSVFIHASELALNSSCPSSAPSLLRVGRVHDALKNMRQRMAQAVQCADAALDVREHVHSWRTYYKGVDMYVVQAEEPGL